MTKKLQKENMKDRENYDFEFLIVFISYYISAMFLAVSRKASKASVLKAEKRMVLSLVFRF